MLETLQQYWLEITASPETMALVGLAAGVLVLVFGVASLGRTPAEIRRMRSATLTAGGRPRADLVRDDDFDLGGLLKAFAPSSEGERTRIGRRMRKAGVKRRNGVYLYYLVRAVLGIGLPALFIGLTVIPAEYTAWIPERFSPQGMQLVTIFQVAIALSIMGFYSPALWLQVRIKNRSTRIRQSLPNALDLLQVAVEAGLGFDAAMVRISREMASAAPDISQEFMMMQLEIQAGKDRHAAFTEMADRCSVAEMQAFATVVLQANQFGTSISSALTNYAAGLRLDRELKANEKANRLPVQMSAVLALFMMPTLLMICLFPMVIRWIRMFGGG